MQFFFTTLLADAVKLKQTSFEYCTCKLILWRSDFHPVPSGRRDASLKETRTERHQRGVRPLSEGWQKKSVKCISRSEIPNPLTRTKGTAFLGVSTQKPVPSWIWRFNQIIQMTKMHFDVRQTSDDGALGNHETMQHSISVSAMEYDGTWLWVVLRKIGLFFLNVLFIRVFLWFICSTFIFY